MSVFRAMFAQIVQIGNAWVKQVGCLMLGRFLTHPGIVCADSLYGLHGSIVAAHIGG